MDAAKHVKTKLRDKLVQNCTAISVFFIIQR